MERNPGRHKGLTKWLLLAAAALALIAAAVLLLPRPAGLMPAPAPSEALLAGGEGLDDITVTAAYAPARRTLTVRQELRLVNRTGEALTTVVLRAYPNAFASEETSPAAAEDALYAVCYPDGFSPGSLSVRILSANGAICGVHYADTERTVLSIALQEPWQPGAELNLVAEYDVLAPIAAYRLGESGDVVCLGNALLIPAVWQDGAYRVDSYSGVGDPFWSECRNYHVTLTVPDGWTVGGTGYALPEETDAGRVYRMEALAARDFALCLSPAYTSAQRQVDGVLVTALARDAKQAKWLLDAGAQALEYLSGLLSAYPYPTLTLCEFAMGGGMEYPAMAMIGADRLAAADEQSLAVVTHEVAHQWFYAMVGSDEVRSPWQDESLCEYLVLRWAADTGRAALYDDRVTQIGASYLVTLGSDVTPGMPLSYYPDTLSYTVAVYQRGTDLFLALETFLGQERLTEFLRAYVRTYAFRLCDRADFEALLNAFTGEDLSPLMLDYLDTLPM